MQRKEFENRIKNLLPKAADDVVESWAAYATELDHSPSLAAFLKSAAMQPNMRKCITDFRIRWMRSSGKEEKRLRKKWKKPEIFSGFFLLLGKQNQVFIGSYSVEAKRRLKSTCWRSKQEQISDRRPVFFRLKNRFSVFVICFWLASATKNCSDS